MLYISDIYFCFRFAVMLYLLLMINLITFVTFAVDKWKSIRHKRRISESFLLILTFFGGTIGAFLAMIICRHKVSKGSFLIKWGGIVVLQLFVLAGCWNWYVGSFGKRLDDKSLEWSSFSIVSNSKINEPKASVF